MPRVFLNVASFIKDLCQTGANKNVIPTSLMAEITFFNEQFNFYHFLGATLIVLGLFLSNKEIKNA